MIRVLIYCASGYGERVLYSLDDEKYEVVGLVDSNPEVWGKPLYGLGNVLAPDQIADINYDLIIIAISEYASVITRDLVQKYGVESDKIVVYQSQENGIVWQDERIVMLRKCMALLKERNVRGDMAEVGVYKGDFSKLFNRYFPDRKLYLFDTFEGFDARDGVEKEDIHRFKDTSVDIVLSKMKCPENCIVRKGYFPDTAEGIEGTFSLVSLDCDLYKPILAGLEFFYPRLAPGGYIFIHDFGSYRYETVKHAVLEYCDEHAIPVFPIVDRCLTAIVSK